MTEELNQLREKVIALRAAQEKLEKENGTLTLELQKMCAHESVIEKENDRASGPAKRMCIICGYEQEHDDLSTKNRKSLWGTDIAFVRACPYDAFIAARGLKPLKSVQVIDYRY